VARLFNFGRQPFDSYLRFAIYIPVACRSVQSIVAASPHLSMCICTSSLPRVELPADPPLMYPSFLSGCSSFPRSMYIKNWASYLLLALRTWSSLGTKSLIIFFLFFFFSFATLPSRYTPPPPGSPQTSMGICTSSPAWKKSLSSRWPVSEIYTCRLQSYIPPLSSAQHCSEVLSFSPVSQSSRDNHAGKIPSPSPDLMPSMGARLCARGSQRP
jgi:hypothetical protein